MPSRSESNPAAQLRWLDAGWGLLAGRCGLLKHQPQPALCNFQLTTTKNTATRLVLNHEAACVLPSSVMMARSFRNLTAFALKTQ